MAFSKAFCIRSILALFAFWLILFSLSSLWDRHIAEILRLKDWQASEETTRSLFIRQNGKYWILYNYVRARRKLNGNESITYTTHGEYTYLDNLEELIMRWRAPISIALYACGSDFETTLNYIRYLRSCSSVASLIEDMITFHIFFHEDHMPEFVPKTDKEILQYNDCSQISPFFKNSGQRHSTYRAINKLLYPINIARNIARHEATTYYVFPLDIELLPSKNFVRQFLEMVGPMKLAKQKSVFVAAIFEMKAGYNVPTSKTKLQKMLRRNIAISFHASFAYEYHAIPYLGEWISRKEPDHMEVFKVVRRENDKWEPFYVTINKEEPYFDEHFTWEGQYDKRIQADLLTAMNYDFLLLDKPFLVHRPGIKQHHVPDPQSSALRLQMKVKAQTIYKMQIQKLYGENKFNKSMGSVKEDMNIDKKFYYEPEGVKNEVVQEIVDDLWDLPETSSKEQKATFGMEARNKKITGEGKQKITLAQDIAGKEKDTIDYYESQEVSDHIWHKI